MVALLADAFPEKGLAPSPGLSFARADYLQVLHSGASIDMMLWQIRIHEDILRESEKDERTVVRYKSKFSKEIDPQLRSRLDRGPFICGDQFSAADCVIAHCIVWARLYGLCAGEPFDRYLNRMSERSAYRSAFSDIDRFVQQVPRGSACRSDVHGLATYCERSEAIRLLPNSWFVTPGLVPGIRVFAPIE